MLLSRRAALLLPLLARPALAQAPEPLTVTRARRRASGAGMPWAIAARSNNSANRNT